MEDQDLYRELLEQHVCILTQSGEIAGRKIEAIQAEISSLPDRIQNEMAAVAMLGEEDVDSIKALTQQIKRNERALETSSARIEKQNTAKEFATEQTKSLQEELDQISV